ncbi:hypothetical protein RHMOL_Rhmol09G0210500 [Rhododendron molle]|uniref:Uncharacterized protein n=2 Tax=Rhododendron molle TaxID=49168 RepID=A0ACC0MFH6_RHOML|nr:hypothetical protein RHMOL_Rhmol09G0210500 [Rhododendron molle]KAI8539793.1 hypothetical protein RHMOL_Rhmol09G0210500 [Rhododendron molle]
MTKQQESSLEKLSSLYLDGEEENKHAGGERSPRQADESERIIADSKFSDHDLSQSRTKGKHDRPDERELGKAWDRDSMHSERRETIRDKSRRDGDHLFRTPDKNGRLHHESENYEVGYERGFAFKRKELEKDGGRDDNSKGRDESSSERKRDQEDSSKDNWKRRQPSSNYAETKDVDITYGRDRNDNKWPQGRFGGRKDARWTEAVKTSTNYGISNDNYDVIEIQTKPFDYGREESRSTIVRSTEAALQSDSKLATPNNEWTYRQEDKEGNIDMYKSGQSGNDLNDRYLDKELTDKGFMPNRTGGGHSSSSVSQTSHGNQQPGSFSRPFSQGAKGSRVGRGGRGRSTGRDNQLFGTPMPIIGSPFGPLGPILPLTPSMSPSPGPPISHGIFIPQFSPPLFWPGAQGVEMNMLAIPPGLPSGPSGARFSPNMGVPPNPGMYFNQPGPGSGVPSNVSTTGVDAMVQIGQGPPQDKTYGNWVSARTSGPPGKAPSRGEQNDYSQNFVDSGTRPQNFVRELELTTVVEDYPKLRELIQKKDEIVAKSASSPMYYKCDLREHVLSPEFFGTKFDVILVDPPWEEYVHRAPGVSDHMEYWTFEEIMNLKIELIADTPSFIFLWVGDGVGLELGRQCLKKWGFRRCEDICWVKTNKTNATPGLRHDFHTLFQRSKEHCLMGIKGTVRRGPDGHIIHANIDTDVIIAEEPPYGSTAKPEDMYRIVEHFALGRRRLELFGEDHNIRSGWLTVGKGLSSSNFNSEAYIRNFADEEGKVWPGGRNPPPEAPHLVLTTPDIEALRPKSPMKNHQQMQQSTFTSPTTISIT